MEPSFTSADPAFRSIVVVGAAGQMGALFAKRARALGATVHELDKPLAGPALEAVPGADLVLLCVPLGAIETVLEEIAPLLDPGTVLADIVSVKVKPLKAMLRAHAGPVVATHPLFGSKPPKDARVAMIPSGRVDDEAACARVEAWMRALGFDTFRTTAEKHDQAMAMVQGLNFVTTIAYLAAMADPELTPYITPSLGRRLDAAHKMVTHDASLFETIFEANPFSQDAVRRYRNFLHVAAGGDLDLLVERAQWWWRENVI
ncbi:prephenate dehydrogenase/arogenate dehydrogenase family protein [Oceanidesulfovibrio marinus]|nr:prephenate dehydrogenase/arogenate dehydrogenase family protein [Oceanidesulfovibrio marinus]